MGIILYTISMEIRLITLRITFNSFSVKVSNRRFQELVYTDDFELQLMTQAIAYRLWRVRRT